MNYPTEPSEPRCPKKSDDTQRLVARCRRRFRALPGALLVGLMAAVDCCITLTITATSARADEQEFKVIPNVTYATRDGRPLRADVFQPAGKGPFPGVLCVHGGAWMSGSKSHMLTVARRLVDSGYVVVAINYRLAPRHKFPAQIEDCREAVAWIKKNAGRYKVDPKRLGAWGYSAGGHLVALLGTEGTDLKAVVAGGAPCDFRQIEPGRRHLAYWLGGSRAKLPKVYQSASPAAFVSDDDPPFLFYHGERDRLVNVDQPRAMAESLRKAGVSATVHVVPRAGHIVTFLDKPAAEKGVKFLDEHLR